MVLRVTWWGHATTVLRLDDGAVVTDPVLGRNNGPLRRRGPVPDQREVADVDAVLISHLHHDHAELSSLDKLRGVPVLTAKENARWLRKRGITSAVGLPDDDWWTVAGTALRVRQVRADHGHRPMPHRPNATHGHLLRGSAVRIWVAGDTSLYDEMADLPTLAGGTVDLALVPVGGWGPRLSGGHLDPRTAARACALVGAAAAIPVHWGTLYVPGTQSTPRGWLDRPGPAFLEALATEAPDCEGHLLAPGETLELAS